MSWENSKCTKKGFKIFIRLKKYSSRSKSDWFEARILQLWTSFSCTENML